MDHEMSDFARAIYKSKYAKVAEDGTVEEWYDTARRVATHVMGALPVPAA